MRTVVGIASLSLVLLVEGLGAPLAAAQEAASVVVEEKAPVRQGAGMPARRVRFWPVMRAGLLGSAIGGGIGLLAGTVDEDLFYRDEREHGGDGDDDDIPALLPGIWLGATVGALAGAHADVEDNAGVLWLSGGAALLGGAAGGALGYIASGGRDWAGVGAAGIGAAGGAAFALWAAAGGRSGKRPALLRVGKAGAALGVPVVERRRVPLTPQRGWRAPLVRVQF